MSDRARAVVVIGDGVYALSLAELLQLGGYAAQALTSDCRNYELLAPLAPAALVIDLMVARRNDFALLRRLQADPDLAGVPVLVSSPGTVAGDVSLLERQVRALGAHPHLEPHDLDAIVGEIESLSSKVAQPTPATPGRLPALPRRRGAR